MTMTSQFLGKLIAKGGEGAVYEVKGKPNLVAKIFHKKEYARHLPAQASVLKSLSSKFVIPIDIIGNPPEGFTMTYLNHDWNVIAGLKYIPKRKKWGVGDPIDILRQVIGGVEEAHSKSIIIKDLNPENVLFRKSEVRFIDTTAYKLPRIPSNDVIQPEVTDWLFNAQMNEEGDYYALAVICFEILTGVHPYGGRKYNLGKTDRLKKRAIRKESLLGSHGVSVPPSFRPPSDYVKDQFVAIFETGDRFLLNLDKPVIIQKIVPIAIKTDKISIQLIGAGDVKFWKNYLQINDKTFILEDRGKWKSDIWPLEDRSLGLREVVIGKWLLTVNPDELIITDLEDGKVQKREIFGKSYFVDEGVTQRLEKSFLFVDVGFNIAKIESEYRVDDYYQFGPYVCMKYEGKFGYAKAESNSKIILETDEMRKCTFKKYIFEPDDGKINIRRSEDFQIVMELPVNVCSTHSTLHATDSGILVINDEVYLVNNG